VPDFCFVNLHFEIYKSQEGGLITLTEIILHCQIKYLIKDLLQMSLWCIRFLPNQKTKAVRAIGQCRTLLITAVCVKTRVARLLKV